MMGDQVLLHCREHAVVGLNAKRVLGTEHLTDERIRMLAMGEPGPIVRFRFCPACSWEGRSSDLCVKIKNRLGQSAHPLYWSLHVCSTFFTREFAMKRVALAMCLVAMFVVAATIPAADPAMVTAPEQFEHEDLACGRIFSRVRTLRSGIKARRAARQSARSGWLARSAC